MTLESDQPIHAEPEDANTAHEERDSQPEAPASRFELYIPPAAMHTYNASQNKNQRMERWKLGVEILTLAAVIYYACVARGQLSSMEKAYGEIQTQTGQIQQQTKLMRQQLVGSQAAVLTFQPLGFNSPHDLSLSISNDGHINALDVHIYVTATKESISGHVLDTPKHYSTVVPVVKAAAAWSGLWNLPWTFRQIGESGKWPVGWPGNETFEFKGTVVYDNGFGDIITVSLCQKWLPNFSIITINPLNRGKGSSGGGGF